jgi:hypothetical protein
MTDAGGQAARGPDVSPTEVLWDLLAQPVDPWGAAETLLGMSHGAARFLAAILLLSSPEAEDLLDAMPTLTRSLTIGTVGRPERSSGELRGPILWSETMAARAASSGDHNVFVFSIAARAYDTAENRVLVAALRALVEAARTVDTHDLRERDTELGRLVNHRAMLAHRWLEHRAFADVPHRVSRRDRQRTRAGTGRRKYGLALDVLERHAVPLTADELALVTDVPTRAQHRALGALIAELRRRGVDIPTLTIHRGILQAGPLTYIHPRSRRGRAERRSGIYIGDRAVDVPAVVEGRMLRVGATSPGDGEGEVPHLFLGTLSDAGTVLDAAGY